MAACRSWNGMAEARAKAPDMHVKARATAALGLGRWSGRRDGFGLPRPDHPPLAAHPTVSQDLLVRLGRGDIVPKLRIDRFKGKTVGFADESVVEADVVVCCTGGSYRVSGW